MLNFAKAIVPYQLIMNHQNLIDNFTSRQNCCTKERKPVYYM